MFFINCGTFFLCNCSALLIIDQRTFLFINCCTLGFINSWTFLKWKKDILLISTLKGGCKFFFTAKKSFIIHTIYLLTCSFTVEHCFSCTVEHFSSVTVLHSWLSIIEHFCSLTVVHSGSYTVEHSLKIKIKHNCFLPKRVSYPLCFSIYLIRKGKNQDFQIIVKQWLENSTI